MLVSDNISMKDQIDNQTVHLAEMNLKQQSQRNNEGENQRQIETQVGLQAKIETANETIRLRELEHAASKQEMSQQHTLLLQDYENLKKTNETMKITDTLLKKENEELLKKNNELQSKMHSSNEEELELTFPLEKTLGHKSDEPNSNSLNQIEIETPTISSNQNINNDSKEIIGQYDDKNSSNKPQEE